MFLNKRKLTKQYRRAFATGISVALGLVLALAWQDALKAVTDEILDALGVLGSGYSYKIAAAVIITIICVVGIAQVSKWSK